MTRHDTAPTDADRAHARDLMARCGDLPGVRSDLVTDLLGAYLDTIGDVGNPVDARSIARSRALIDAYREETNQ